MHSQLLYGGFIILSCCHHRDVKILIFTLLLWRDVQDALEPYMSRRTVELHWGKLHQDYVDGLNKQLATSPLYGHTLEELIKEAYNNGSPLPEYNNAAQVVVNHASFD
jgi:superoxide dismutase